MTWLLHFAILLQWIFFNVTGQVARHIATPAYSVRSLQAKKKLRDKLQRGNVARCNPLATCFTAPLQVKLQEKLNRVTLAVVLH